MQRSRLIWTVLVMALAPYVPCAGVRAESPSDMDKARMDAAIQFAETVLKYGRDTYGEKHTPLFTDMLDVDTMKAPEKIYITRVGNKRGPTPPWVSVVSSDLSYQGNLMRFLAGLSNLTGQPKYKGAYKDCIRYYFQHYQTKSGLLQMGHHRFVDLKADHYDGDDLPPGVSGHEMKGDYPYYDLFWETDPEATRKMLAGHWNSHIKNWDNMNFTRHGYYHKTVDESVWDRPLGKPVKGIMKGDLTFFDSGSDIIWAGGKLSQLGGDERPQAWAKRLFARYIDNAHPQTGLPPCHHTSLRVFGEPGKSWPEYAILFPGSSNALFGHGATMLMRLGDVLGDQDAYFRESVHKYLKAFAKYAYNPKDNTLRNILYDGTDLSVDDRDGSGSTWKANSDYMMSYALCYRQSKDREIWDTLRAICRGNDLGDIGKAGDNLPKLNTATSKSDPNIIFALVEIFRATDNRAYLDLARVIGNNALRQHYNAERGLFVASELHKVANLNASEPLAFLTLEAALCGKLDRVPTYDGSTVGNASGVLRPTKALPYHPTASYCWYPDTVQAMCDELIPDSSNDTSIPCMSWQGSRYPKRKVVATFTDILKGPVSITGMFDAPDAKNWLSGMIIDSPFSYTFAGSLNASRDFTVTVLQGDHRWQEGTWSPSGWTPSRAFVYILDIAAGARFTFAGIILEQYAPWWHSGAGLIKNGEGTAVVTGDYGPAYRQELKDNRAYRRDTVVNAGTLLVNNATGSGLSPRSAVQVNDGGTLGGNGAIGIGGTSAIVSVHAGGTIAPGSGPGTLTLRDGLTLHNGAKLHFELGTDSDLLKITGGTFTGSGRRGVRVSIANSGGLVVGKTYDLIDWTGVTFSGIDVDDFVSDKALLTPGLMAPPIETLVGRFQISGSKLQITITGLPKPPMAETTTKTTAKTLAMNTWINPNGGNWADSANWYGGVVPNGTSKEWAQYNFENPRKVSGVEVYWLDDNGGRRVPESWHVLYRQAGEWKPVEAVGEYGVAKDQFNEVHFKPVKTDALRLDAKLQPNSYGGILEWRVNP